MIFEVAGAIAGLVLLAVSADHLVLGSQRASSQPCTKPINRRLASQAVAVGKRLAAAKGAWICFQDEAGQVPRPPVAKTWARRGHTPVVEVSGKGSGRVSIAGLVCLKPGHRGRLMWRTRLHRNRKGERGSFSEDDYIAFLASPPGASTTSPTWSNAGYAPASNGPISSPDSSPAPE
jgi:hypothetical protein